MIIYRASNKTTGLSYIGMTVRTLQKRWAAHVTASKNLSKRRTALTVAIARYGAADFIVEHIASALNKSDLAALEAMIIEQDGTVWPNGYNLTTGGEGLIDPVPDVCSKISASHKGKTLSVEHRAKIANSLKGKPRPQEVKLKIGAGHRGKAVSDETREKIAAANRRRKHTAETKAKMSAIQKSTPNSGRFRPKGPPSDTEGNP